ncbi:MAG: DNA polymerase III subunit gamma/tau [Acidimicrobiia bacterium]|nr:DNA polymerase III subunit gamma/tau [Acidimicrobiia bacterium]
MAYQSLYRRYRSQRFSELRGQSHVTTALKSAVANDRVGHAYLFSGPRGTGKTSTARILAKALNCASLGDDGEPCGECESCVSIENGRSFDVHELDAASNNKVDDIRDLISRVNLGSPGNTKVYILDEVHMLSAGAENALLKTLEEPPDHVVFVLATTEPHKVVQTIRSRTQPFEFHLLPADELEEHVRWVIEDAGLDIPADKVDEAVDYVLRQGGGSARDTLSALDLVAAAGGVPAGSDIGLVLVNAIGDGDPQAAIAGLQQGLSNGQEPRVIGEAMVEVLRGAFLAVMGASLAHLNDTAQTQARDLGAKLGPATLTRSLESIGTALVDMRQAPDPRVPLEVTLLRLCRDQRAASQVGAVTAGAGDGGEGGGSTDDATRALVSNLVNRISSLEQQVSTLQEQLADAGGATPGSSSPSPASSASSASSPSRLAAAASSAASSPEPSPAAAPSAEANGPAAAARNRLAEVASTKTPRSTRSDTTPPATTPPQAEAAPAAHAPAAEAPPEAEPAPAAQKPEPPVEQTLSPEAAAAPANGTGGRTITAGEMTQAFETQLDDVSQRARVRFQVGTVSAVNGSTIVVAVPNSHYVSRCQEVKTEVEQALSRHFNQPLTVDVIVDTSAPSESMDPAKLESPRARPTDDSLDDVGPVEDLADASDQSTDGVDRLTRAFPGSKIIEPKPE